MTRIAKISVEKFDSKQQILYDFDKNITLEENVKIICRKMGLPASKVYGVKQIPTNANNKDFYISESNVEEIEHNDCLKVVFSMDYLVARIVNNILNTNENLRAIVFEDILKYSLDPVFIEELVRVVDGRPQGSQLLIDIFIEDTLSSDEQRGLLATILHLFALGYIEDTSKDILTKVISLVKSSSTTDEELRFSLSLLQKILTCTKEAFNQWKERIIKNIAVSEISQFILRENSRNLQYSALLLINTIIRLCKSEKKQQLIKEMNYRKTRENIYNHIILHDNLERNMEHELYVLQTYLLSLFNEALKSKININDNSLFSRDEFELGSEDMRRITILMDFDDTNMQNHHAYLSVENLAFNNRDSVISLASVQSNESTTKRRPFSEYDDGLSISHLTLEALRHYKNVHSKNFYQSQIEEQLYEPGIFVTSQRVVKMLAKILHIGVDPPDSKSTFYQPVVFYCSSKTPFFLELFSRTMWLLSRTRREMKASTFADYEKVMYILQKQVHTALEKKPKNFVTLTAEMTATSFQGVIEQIGRKKEEEINNLLQKNACIIELKERFMEVNRTHVYDQRINLLLQGGHFPKVLEKKATGSIFVKLSKNLKELLVFDNADVKTPDKCQLMKKILIDDITHVVIGKNCKHINLCTNPLLAFTIIIGHEEELKFIAKDEKSACYWIDGFLLVLKKDLPDKLSKYYYDELNELTLMDVRLQLLELQNISIPKNAPAVPPPPEVLPPEIPPKPKPRRDRFK